MTLLQGNCLEQMKTLADNSVDLVLADPPYGTTACKWDTIIPFGPMWKEIGRVSKKSSAICIFGSEPFSSFLRKSNIDNFKYDLIWDKGVSGSFVQAKTMPLKTHEIISIFSHGGKHPRYFPVMIKHEKARRIGSTNNDKTRSGSIPIKGDSKVLIGKIYKDAYPKSIHYFSPRADKSRGLHPTQKPVALLEYLIKTYTQENDVVLDFCMGSGSTGVAARNLNRKFIGIEMNEEYFNIAKERIS